MKRCSICKQYKASKFFYPHIETRDKLRTECKYCSSRISSNWCKNHRKECNIRYQKYYFKQKAIVYNHYGNKCKCCDEKMPEFLTLDHVNNDGYKNRKTTVNTYIEIIKQNYPKTYQILCMNCNFGKKINKGICPHKRRLGQ